MKRAGSAVIFELADMIGDDCNQTRLRIKRQGTVYPWLVRSVPEPFYDGLLARLRSAWEVVCGRAYPIKWPQPGELERSISGDIGDPI